MLQPLLRHLRGLPLLLLLVLAIFSARPALASHFLGGEMSYRYLDATGPTATPFRYEITAVIYINDYAPDNPAPANPFLDLSLYNKSTNNIRIAALQIPRVSLSGSIAPPTPGNCTLPSPPRPFKLAVYQQIVNLPVSFSGYYALLVANARNVVIDNINTANNNTPLSLYLDMAAPLIPNRSPVFSDTAVAVICQGDTAIMLNSAVDADGDRLTYAFGTPAGGGAPNTFTPPPPAIPYYPNHSVTQPFGPGGYASINATTGLAKYKGITQGEYVVAIDVSEYRTINGTEILLGTTRRDIQLVVRPCPPNTPPQLPPSTGTGGPGTLPRNYTIEEGQSLTIPFSATDPNGDPLVLQLNSVLLDGTVTNGFNAALNGNQGTVQPGNVTGTAQVTGTGSVSGSFVYNSRCGEGRSNPYNISVTVQDRGCGGQTIADVFTVQVNRAAGPTGITGPTVVCDPATIRTYTAVGPTPASYNWVITGGTITSGQGTNTVQVRWNSTPTTGTLTLNGVSSFGCASTPVTTSVDIRPLAALTVTPTAPNICRGASATLTVSGPAGLTYTWSGGSQTGSGNSIVVTPQTTTTYTVTGTDGTCSTSQQVTVTVTPPPTADAGPNRSFCSGQSAQLGTAAVAGNSYSWSPATGLSSTTVAQPTVTLTNTTGAPITTTYTLTVTTSNGCVSTGTVQVTVNPGATADAGPNRSFCSGQSAQLGTAAIAGTTYSWSPATGLSSTTVAQPTVTGTNTTGAPVTTTYTVTATTANGCTATSTVTVTVNPAAVATVGPNRTLCSGQTVQLGAAPVAGTTYSWSPTTGLSNPNIANPVVTTLNTTGTPATIIYTLTATTANGCVATATVQVTVNPLPVVDAGADRAVCSGIATQVGTAGVAGVSYAWTPATGLSSASAATPSLTLTNTTGTAFTVRYYVTATSSLNCPARDSVDVTVNPAAVANPGPAVSFCSGGSVQIGSPAVAGTTYSWSPATGLSSTTVAQPTVTGTNTTGAPTSTTYTLTATTANGCVATATVVVTINPAAIANAGPAVTTCSDVAAQLGVAPIAGTTYSWSPTTGLSNANIANPTVTLTNNSGTVRTATYTLTATTAQGCTATSTVVVSVNPAAVANPGPAVSFCSGGSVQIGSPAVAGTTYSWSPTTGLSDPTAAQPTVTGTNTTSAPISTTYTLTATTANGCSSTNTVLVTINQAAVANAGQDRTQCVGYSGRIGMLPIPGTTYSWSPITGLSDPTASNPTLAIVNTTGSTQVLTYTLTATTAQGCTATDDMQLTLYPAAVANPGPAVSFCSGGSAQLGVAPIAGTVYSWTPTTGLSDPTSSNPTVMLTNTTGAPITTTYTLTASITNPGGNICSSGASVVVTVNPAAVANPGPALTICSGVSGQLGVAPVAGTTYSWSPTTGLSDPTLANPTVTLTNTTSAPTTTTYTLTATTTNGCTATNTVVVTVNPAAVADAGPAVSFCSGGSAQLGVAPVAGTTYAWSPATGLSSATVANPTVTLTNTTGAPVVTTYSLTATTADGCIATATVAVTVNQAAVANPGPDVAFCGGVPTQLGVAPVAGTTYSWSPTGGLTDPNIANPLITLPNTTGSPIVLQYTLTATTAQGCTATSTVNLTVNPEAVADTGSPQSTCSGGTVQLGAAPIAGTTYSWTQVSGPASPLSNPNISNPTATLTNTTSGTITYIYSLTATTANGCVATRGVRIDVFPAAVANTGSAQTICSGATIQLGGAPVAGTTYSWSPTTGLSDPTISNPTATLTNTTSAPITTTYTLTATTADNCVATNTVTVTVNPAPVVDAGNDRSVCADVRTTLGSAAQTGYTYAWTPTTGLSSASAAQPVLNTTGLNTGTTPLTLKYYLLATTPQGCAARDSVQVTINPRPAAELIVGSASVCPTVTGVAYSVVNPTGTAYQWIVNGGTIASGQGTTAITVDWGMAGSGSVKLFSVNALGCSSDTTTLPVIINQVLQTPTPNGPGNVLAAAPNNSVCQGGGPYVYATSPYTNGSLYSWTIIGGTQASTNLNTVTVNWNPVTVPTIGKIVVTETSNPASGIRCLGTSDTLRVLINPTPLSTLTLNGPARVCQGGSVTFTLPGGFAGSSYAFLLGGSPVSGSGNSVTLANQNTPGTYTLTAQETSAQGCVGPVYSATFTVDPTPAPATITGPRFVCDITQPLQYSVANNPGSTYNWTVTGGTITAGQTTSQVTVTFTPGQTTYGVSVSETSTFGCAGPGASLTVLPDNPSVTLAVASVDVTSNNRVILTFTSPGSINTPNQIRVLRREAGVGSFAVVGTVAPSATSYIDATVDASTKSYEYQLELTNGCGTVLQSVVTQTVLLQATAAAGAGGRDQGNVALRWNAYVGFPVQEYQVFRRDDNGNPVLVTTVSGSTLTANLPNPGTGFNQCYRIVAVGGSNQASNSNLACVDFSNPLAFYNVITPNNDGKNDVLEIDNIKLYPGNTLTIFNRWGREVYNTSNYQNNWGGDGQSAGVYYYLLKMPNGSSTKGWFEIIK